MMHPRLLPRIHPFWLTLGYGIFVGYQVRKYDLDKKIIAAVRARQDIVTHRQAAIYAEEMKRVNETMLTGKVTDGTKG